MRGKEHLIIGMIPLESRRLGVDHLIDSEAVIELLAGEAIQNFHTSAMAQFRNFDPPSRQQHIASTVTTSMYRRRS